MDTLKRQAQDLLGLRLTPAHLRAFGIYSARLVEWNERVNLTAITDPQEIQVRHFLDSLSCLLVMRPQPGLRVADVGSGAGFPGLPLKIVCPGLDMTLIEATGKKVDFLRAIVGELGLERVTLLAERAEAVGQIAAHHERYDWVLARAVAGMRTLAEYLLPLCRVGGRCLAQKGEGAPQEVAGAQHAIELLGGHIAQLKSVELPGVPETHYLVQMDKRAATPPGYPRRPGMPSKRPL
jgi:16S rRNA (guanine527-N7)-methyltransferase